MCIRLVWGLKKKGGKTMGKMIEDADKVLDAMEDAEPESCPECGAWMYEIRGEPGLWACPSCGNEEYYL